MKKLLKLDSFWIRIIALFTMTIDHIGVFLDIKNFYLLRIIGRIALPLFVFMTVEGALKTSNKKKYIIRLSAMFLATSIFLLILTFIGGFVTEVAFGAGNIFFDLLLVVLMVTFLESPNKKIKLLAILPILYSVFSFIVVKLEGCGCDGLYYWLLPSFRVQYGFYGLLLGLGYYISYKISSNNPKYNVDYETKQTTQNILSLITIVFATLILAVVNYLFGNKYAQPIDSVQSYAVISGLFILFYSGKRGYSAKWFKVAYYLYYPVHLGIITLIFMLLEGVL